MDKNINKITIEPTSLEYKTINSVINNILLIDNSVYQNDILFNSTNSNVFAIKYNINSSKKELEELMTNNFTKIDRIGFAFNDALINSKQFLDNNFFFTSDDLTENTYSSNLQFIIDLIKKFNITNVDYLVCNGLKYDNWVKYFDILNKETGVIIGASNNETRNRNLKYEGEQIMVNTNENINNIYWSENIINYTSRLVTTTISSSITITNNNDYIWPVTINGGSYDSPIVITFSEDLTLNSTSNYFIIDSEYIVIDGENFNVIIDGVTDYPGLVKNGTDGINGKSNITIQNINISTLNSSTLAAYKGWICWDYFGANATTNIIKNCSSSGDITNLNSGGIFGYYSFGAATNCYSTGTIGGQGSGGIYTYSLFGTATDCYSTGTLSGQGSGGIFGSEFGAFSSGTATNCYSLGAIIGINSGGIFGSSSNGTATNCHSSGVIGIYSNNIVNNSGGIFGSSSSGTATNCYSLGDINGIYSGGIFGSSAYGTATNCYSSGSINGSGSGGIFGYFSTGTATAINCYSSGIISGDYSGGIFGYLSSVTSTATNCYSLGNIIGIGAGGIFESSSSVGIVTNCYIANGTWDDSLASENLTGIPTYNSGTLVNPIGETWVDIALNDNNIPWLFATFGYSPYTTELTATFTQSIQQGEKTIQAIETFGHTYTLISINDNLPSSFSDITINTETGEISTSLLTQVNTYFIKVMKNSTYTMTNFELIVISGSKPTPIPIPNNKCKKYYVRLKCNEKFIIILNEVYSKCALIEKYKIVNKPCHGTVRLNSKSKLVYTSDKNYIGNDKFSLLCDNIMSLPQSNVVIEFYIKISK